MPSLPLDGYCLPFSQLSSIQLYQLLQLRADIFVVEQNCAYQDLDGKDTHPETLHLALTDKNNNTLLAYARILAPGIAFSSPAIGRVVVAAQDRNKGLGKILMQKALATIEQHWPQQDIEISAQCQWQGFYRQLGFVSEGETYLEDGIPHIHMRRHPDSA